MSRLSDVLSELSRTQRMNQPQIVKRSEELGAPLSKGTVSRYMTGKHPDAPQLATLDAFARVFGVPVSDLEAAANYTGLEPFQPHPSADQLTASQRAVVNSVIRELADANRRAGTDDGTPMRPEGNFGTRHAPGDLDTDYDEVARRRDEKQAAADAVEYDGMAAADFTAHPREDD